MAEAISEISTTMKSYFCHSCNNKITSVREDFTCPTCGGGFVEEMAEDEIQQGQGTQIDPFRSILAGLSGQSSSSNPSQNNSFFPFNLLLGSSTGETSQQQNGSSRSRSSTRPGGGSGGILEVRQNPGGAFSVSFGPAHGSGSGNEGANAVGGNAQQNPMEQMLMSFLNELVFSLGGGQGGGHVPFPANFGDYVWGRDGLDAIVTQLMNQMEGTGPPPMSTYNLDKLPSVKVGQEEVAKKMQCSVCWEDFKLEEEVKKLDCDHIFHIDCIIPWLKLHGTCPICRRDFTSEEQNQSTESPTSDVIENRNSSISPNRSDPRGATGNQDSPSSRYDADMEFD